jgi:hypothetical protein
MWFQAVLIAFWHLRMEPSFFQCPRAGRHRGGWRSPSRTHSIHAPPPLRWGVPVRRETSSTMAGPSPCAIPWAARPHVSHGHRSYRHLSTEDTPMMGLRNLGPHREEKLTERELISLDVEPQKRDMRTSFASRREEGKPAAKLPACFPPSSWSAD